ncbi:MAG: 2-oxoacid:ferredoxin oxidoreductase subunit beta [Desulfovermiculus sp.]|nr:2-oxoacid:ferredoxin oxidoreductase subunit beta [Desulfovermiculus sp.]
MVSIEDFGQYETAWCPGCGNFSISTCVKKALAGKNIAPHQVLFVSGIGQAAKAPHYMNCHLFNGLHGRSLPVATGARLANQDLTVIAESGDGCMYGEGGNHFLAALRRNVNLTMLVHDNQIYGLTKGQASPTSGAGHVTKAQPHGLQREPFHPLSVAMAMQAGFVARGFTGLQDQLMELIQAAIDFPGFALVDILQQCVSFNHVNTFKWYKERCQPLDKAYDPSDWEAAMSKSLEWGDSIPTGILYKNDSRKTFEQNFSACSKGPLFQQQRSMEDVARAMEGFA